jgi:MFS family permease
MIRNSTIFGMVVLTSVRAMAHGGLNIFLIVYMDEDLGFSEFQIGYHMSLLTLLGVGSAPLLGWMSDKIGRRPVIVFGLSAISALVFCLLPFGDGLALTIILACLGIFLYSINPVMLATSIDAVPKGTESSVTAIMFTGPAIFGAIAPVLAGRLRELYGMDAVFIFTATIVGFVALAAVFTPMRKDPQS